jgi:hypothetical protein
MTTDFSSVGGLLVKTVKTTMGKKEDERGTIQIVLEASKEDVTTGEHDFSDILAAMNVHQEGKYPVTIRVVLPTNRG